MFDAAKMKSGEAPGANFSGIGRNCLFLVGNEGRAYCVLLDSSKHEDLARWNILQALKRQHSVSLWGIKTDKSPQIEYHTAKNARWMAHFW